MNIQDNLENGGGFGETSSMELEELRKALSVGTTIPPTGSDTIRVESLESTLKLLTYQASNIRLWQMIEKLDAYSTVEEFNRLSAYGSEGGGFNGAGVLPEEEDTTYSRSNELVKYCGTTRAVAHPTTLIRTVPSDIIAQETSNGALWLMGKINSSLYNGDATAIPVEWNGLTKQIVSGAGNVVDLRGAAMTEKAIENGAQLVVDNFGMPSKFFSNGKVFSDFAKIYYGLQRWAQPGAPAGAAGTPITSFTTINGRIDFEPDQFVKRGMVVPAAATSAKAPTAPTIGTFTTPVFAGSLFVAGDVGAYIYQVTAVNQYGESLPTAASAGQTIAAGDSVNFVITDGGGSFPATAYKIYRTEKDGATTYFLGFLKARDQIATVYQATTPVVDGNEYLPRCFGGLMLDMSTQSLSFKQLSPMIKMPLAVIGPAIRWMQLLYGTPIVYAPKKNVVYRNIGALETV